MDEAYKKIMEVIRTLKSNISEIGTKNIDDIKFTYIKEERVAPAETRYCPHIWEIRKGFNHDTRYCSLCEAIEYL